MRDTRVRAEDGFGGLAGRPGADLPGRVLLRAAGRLTFGLGLALLAGWIALDAASAHRSKAADGSRPQVGDGSEYVRRLSQSFEAPALHARSGPSGSLDVDVDGLPDALELLIGCSPDLEDTDGDGFSDAEEVARGSSALDAAALPSAGPVTVNLLPFQVAGSAVHLVSAIYVADGDFTNKGLAMGVRVGTKLRQLPIAFFADASKFTWVGGKALGSQVLIINGLMDSFLVKRFGSLSVFTKVLAGGTPVAAGVTNLVDRAGVVVGYQFFEFLTATAGRMASAKSAGAVYGPIALDADSSEWIQGEICSQRLTLAGAVNGVHLYEVVESGCEPGWDSYCDPQCASSAGSTVESLDPGVLLGG